MPPLPQLFAADTYVAWHNAQFPADAPLAEKVAKLRADLKASARGHLAGLVQILTYAANYSHNEYPQAIKNVATYRVSLSEATRAKSDVPAYDLLFKSPESIINKLWRKNKDAPTTHLGNIQQQMTDLVRTDISATSLDSASFLAHRLNALPGIIYEAKVKKTFNDLIAAIEFGPEMKMASGYFAYHGLVQFKDGLIVEAQIYSELMQQWRKLSHALYDRARIAPIQQHEFNSKESRLISLGHLLHLAECELRQLAQEFAGH